MKNVNLPFLFVLWIALMLGSLQIFGLLKVAGF